MSYIEEDNGKLRRVGGFTHLNLFHFLGKMLGKALYEVRTYVFCNITSHHTTPQNIFNFFCPSCHSIIFYLSSTISKTRSCFASIITKLQDSFTHLLSFLPLRRLFIPSFPCLSLFTIFSNLPFSVLQFTLTGFLTTLCLFLFLFSSLLHMLYYSFTLPTLLSLSILFKRNDRVY